MLLLCEIMEKEEQSERELKNDVMADAEKASSQQLYLLLAMLVKGDGLMVIRNAPRNAGFECWRRLCTRYEPSDGHRTLGLLSKILAFTFGNDLEDMVSKIDEFDLLCREHDRCTDPGDEISDKLMSAIVLKTMPVPLRTHI